jgi:hypothetical protein
LGSVQSASSGDQFEVVTEALRRHAEDVDAIAAEVEVARAAAAHLELGRDAYGKLAVCQLIVALLDPLQATEVDALTASVDGLRRSADAVRTAARRYDSTDRSVATAFGGRT